jgi:hypothetical protein
MQCQLKEKSEDFVANSIAVDEHTDTTDMVQLFLSLFEVIMKTFK